MDLSRLPGITLQQKKEKGNINRSSRDAAIYVSRDKTVVKQSKIEQLQNRLNRVQSEIEMLKTFRQTVQSEQFMRKLFGEFSFIKNQIQKLHLTARAREQE